MLSPLDSLFTATLTLIAALVGLIYWYSTSTFDYWKRKGVPYEPPVPFFGNIIDTILMRRNFCLVHQDLYKRFEGHRFAGIYSFRNPALMIRDPELIKTFLVKDFQHFQDRDIAVDSSRNPLRQHLFLLTGHKWRVLRNKLSPTFTSGRMKSMYTLMDECCKNLINHLRVSADRHEIVEMKDVLGKFSTDIIGTCAFGLQMNAINDPNSEFRRMGRKLLDSSVKRRLLQLSTMIVPQLGKFIRRDEEINNFFLGAVKETADFRIKNNIIRNDFFQLLMNLRYKGKLDDADEEEKKYINGATEKHKDDLDFEFDDGLMAAQAFVFFVAGFETSSSTMSFALHELAANPDIQTKLRKEIDATLEADDGHLTYESVMNMKYLDQVVSETLRLYTPVQFLRRQVTKPYTVPETKVHLEKGMSIVIPVYAIHRDPKYYPNPDRFDPERWTEEEKAKRHHYVYLPFGEGPRNCIGMRFGLLQTKLGLATLLSKYEFHVCERTQIPLRLDPKSLVLASTSGTVVRITNRS